MERGKECESEKIGYFFLRKICMPMYVRYLYTNVCKIYENRKNKTKTAYVCNM